MKIDCIIIRYKRVVRSRVWFYLKPANSNNDTIKITR